MRRPHRRSQADLRACLRAGREGQGATGLCAVLERQQAESEEAVSPIEEKLLAAIQHAFTRRIKDFDREWTCVQQASVLSYRIDMLFTDRHDAGGLSGIRLAVECDGHDWHDRTKQQAAYDRARDRELLRAGIPTIRFTGSEIHHAAERCANEVMDTLLHLVAEDNKVSDAFNAGADEASRVRETVRMGIAVGRYALGTHESTALAGLLAGVL